jgi:hypothetical protein
MQLAGCVCENGRDLVKVPVYLSALSERDKMRVLGYDRTIAPLSLVHVHVCERVTDFEVTRDRDLPLRAPRLTRPGHTLAMLTEEERAAIKVQSLIRGRSGRADYALVRDEEACRQWITYYVALGEYEDAEELGWDGVDPPPPTEEELEANIAAMEMDEGLKADAPSETPQQGARPSRGEQLYEEATRSSSSSKEAEKATVLSPRWLAQIAQSAAGAVVDAGGGLLAAAGSPFGSSSKQIRAAIVVQTWARVVLARAAVRAERRAQAEAELELGQLERQASIIQGAWSHKKAGQRSGVDIEQRAAVLVQSWARVLLAKIAAYHQERQVRLLAFFTHIEDKQASAIQRAYRAARAIRIAGEEAPRSSAVGGGVGGGVGAGRHRAGARGAGGGWDGVHGRHDGSALQQRTAAGVAGAAGAAGLPLWTACSRAVGGRQPARRCDRQASLWQARNRSAAHHRAADHGG